ncbi:hypothetical protein ACFYP6_34030 [Streptomyces goshikiensis]
MPASGIGQETARPRKHRPHHFAAMQWHDPQRVRRCSRLEANGRRQ